jgi:DNA-binding response OmpR family regulator
VLAVSPCKEDQAALRRILAGANWRLESACSLLEGFFLLARHKPSVVICEHGFPDGDWRLILESARNSDQAPILIVSSRLADNRLWAEVLNLGGYDVLHTPYDPEEVRRVLYNAWVAFENVQRRKNECPYPWSRQPAAQDKIRKQPALELGSLAKAAVG